MARVTWNDIGSRGYTTGVDRGMFYDDAKQGYAWDGLISVERDNATKIESIYYDGSKLKDIAILGEYEGSITAYQYPEAFESCQGIASDIRSGVYVTGQSMKTFGLCYRTMHGNDTQGMEYYQLHLVYNLTAVPNSIEHNTISDDVEAIEFEWSVTAVPENIAGYRPTAHLILDSSTMDPLLLSDVEDILYGYDDVEPTMPSMRAVMSLLETWDRLLIIDNDDGTWTAIINNEDDYTDLGSEEFQIDTENVVFLDADTYELTSSNRITEDI